MKSKTKFLVLSTGDGSGALNVYGKIVEAMTKEEACGIVDTYWKGNHRLIAVSKGTVMGDRFNALTRVEKVAAPYKIGPFLEGKELL